MTTEEVIQQFINDIGDEKWNLDQVSAYFENMGIAPSEILGSLFNTTGIHNQNGTVWYCMKVVKLPPNQPH